MDIADLFKNFLVSIFNLMSQIWSTSDPSPATPPRPPSSPPSPPPDSEAQEAATWVNVAHAHHNLNWPKLVLAFCFSSVLDIALQSVQPPSSQLPATFHLLSLAILFAFAPLFVAMFIGSKFPVPARVLEQVGVFFAATAFSLAVTIPLPLSLKCITWAVYAVSLLAILICNRF